MNSVTVNQIKIPYKNDSFDSLINKASKILKIEKSNFKDIKILKKSLDARYKPELYYIYNIYITLKNNNYKKIKDKNVFYNKPLVEYEFLNTINKNIIKTDLEGRIVVIGFGPCGIFASYLLSLCGLKPLIIERGEEVDKREKTVKAFWNGEELDENSNVLFGEGGAGTFSDGKLNTGVNDKFGRNSFILNTFYKFGAPENITYDSKPHIGTDILKTCVKNIREEIKKLGGEFLFEHTVSDFIIKNNTLNGVVIKDRHGNEQEIKTNLAILAIGHSSRDTFFKLHDMNIIMEKKTFAVGLRIQHPQDVINMGQYGCNDKELPASDYKLTYETKEGRNVYSFCMCPGGYVVNSSSEKGKLSINGMSNNDRNSGIANSALVTTITPEMVGLFHDKGPLSGVYYQKELEEKAFILGDGKIPSQYYGDFKNKTLSRINKDHVRFMGEYKDAALHELLPEKFNESIIEAIEYYGNKLKGFNDEKAVLSGIESRTSSPVRIIRDSNFESSIKGLYPSGEGCGYAGGIMSAAIDGLKVAENIIKEVLCSED